MYQSISDSQPFTVITFDDTLNRWFEMNRGRFNYNPVVEKTDSSYIVRFTGCCNHIEWQIWLSETDMRSWILVTYNETFWDIIFDSDIGISRTLDGQYYCNLCIYDTQCYNCIEDLLIAHALDPTLEWLNEHLIPENYLWICGQDLSGGWTKARILPKDAKSRDREYLLDLIPIVES